jgi:hypothetical protein
MYSYVKCGHIAGCLQIMEDYSEGSATVNETHALVHADDLNLLDGNFNSIK